MKNIFILLIVLIGASFLSDTCDHAKARENANKPKEKIFCINCGKDLTDDYNRIRPSGAGYYCTPCYQQTMRHIHAEMRAEGYR